MSQIQNKSIRVTFVQLPTEVREMIYELALCDLQLQYNNHLPALLLVMKSLPASPNRKKLYDEACYVYLKMKHITFICDNAR
jgi:hypothetical protein